MSFFFVRMTTMKENKGKGVVGDEDIDQTCPLISSIVKLVPPTLSKKRKMMSKRLDIGNLPSH